MLSTTVLPRSTHPISCSWDRSLEKGMKSTMLNRALDLRDPATGTARGFNSKRMSSLSVSSTRHVLCLATAAVAGRVLTSLNGTFFSFGSGKSVDEFGKSAVPAEQLLVGAALCNFSVDQDENMVGLWQEAHSVSNQDPRL